MSSTPRTNVVEMPDLVGLSHLSERQTAIVAAALFHYLHTGNREESGAEHDLSLLVGGTPFTDEEIEELVDQCTCPGCGGPGWIETFPDSGEIEACDRCRLYATDEKARVARGELITLVDLVGLLES